jgi:hypothetical protein
MKSCKGTSSFNDEDDRQFVHCFPGPEQRFLQRDTNLTRQPDLGSPEMFKCEFLPVVMS